MSKSTFGKVCEDFVGELLAIKTGLAVLNLNEIKMNHPTTDLIVVDSSSGIEYEVSVKAKKGNFWPAVRGVSKKKSVYDFCRPL